MRRYVIVGTGVAGIAAIEAIRKSDAAGEIHWIGDDVHSYYSRPGLAYYLNGEISASLLNPFCESDFRSLNVSLTHGCVTDVQPANQRVVLENGSTIVYDRLLLSTGAASLKPEVPGIELQGVVKLDNLEDAHRIVKLSRKARKAVVIGGGITALEIVEGLRRRGVKTHYFLRGERYWTNVLDEIESKIIEYLLQEQGVEIHFRTEIKEITGRKGRVTGVITKNGQKLTCDLVAVAVGVQPRSQIAQKAGLHVGGGILVNEYMQTSASNVYAAGDVAQVYDPISKEYVLDSLWNLARAQGTAAGLNMAGSKTAYRKPVPYNVTRLANLTTTIIGSVGQGEDADLVKIARGDSETWRHMQDAIAVQSCSDINRLRILIGENTLLGAVIMGDQTLSKPLQQLINQHADITSIRTHLLKEDAPLSNMLVDFWTRWSKDHGPAA